MKKLKAIYPICYAGKQYNPEDALPTYDEKMVKLWIENKAAIWEGEQVVLDESQAQKEIEQKTKGTTNKVAKKTRSTGGKAISKSTTTKK